MVRRKYPHDKNVNIIAYLIEHAGVMKYEFTDIVAYIIHRINKILHTMFTFCKGLLKFMEIPSTITFCSRILVLPFMPMKTSKKFSLCFDFPSTFFNNGK